jgi:flagellar biosynthetic protein FliR
VAIGREIVVGTLAGFAAALTFGALQVAGEVMGFSSGFASSRILNPALETSGSALDQFFLMIIMLVFFALNGHHTFLMGMQRTFSTLPVHGPLLELLQSDLALERIIRMLANLILAGVQMALPIMGALLLTDITLGLLARVAPQIQVFFLGVPIKIGIGLLVLGLSLGVILPIIRDLFNSLGQRLVQLVGG